MDETRTPIVLTLNGRDDTACPDLEIDLLISFLVIL